MPTAPAAPHSTPGAFRSICSSGMPRPSPPSAPRSARLKLSRAWDRPVETMIRARGATPGSSFPKSSCTTKRRSGPAASSATSSSVSRPRSIARAGSMKSASPPASPDACGYFQQELVQTLAEGDCRTPRHVSLMAWLSRWSTAAGVVAGCVILCTGTGRAQQPQAPAPAPATPPVAPVAPLPDPPLLVPTVHTALPRTVDELLVCALGGRARRCARCAARRRRGGICGRELRRVPRRRAAGRRPRGSSRTVRPLLHRSGAAAAWQRLRGGPRLRQSRGARTRGLSRGRRADGRARRPRKCAATTPAPRISTRN